MYEFMITEKDFVGPPSAGGHQQSLLKPPAPPQQDKLSSAIAAASPLRPPLLRILGSRRSRRAERGQNTPINYFSRKRERLARLHASGTDKSADARPARSRGSQHLAIKV